MFLTANTLHPFNFLLWLQEHRVINEQEIYFIKKFHDLYEKMIFLSFKASHEKTVIYKDDHKENKLMWAALMYVIKHNPQGFQALKRLVQPVVLGQDSLYISRHLSSIRSFICSLKKIF